MRIALLLGSLGSFFNLYQMQAMFPELSERFGTGVIEAGWLNMAALGGMLLTAPFAGAMTTRFSPYDVIIKGFTVLAVLNVGVAILPNQELLFAVRLLQGFALPFILTASMQLVAAEKRPKGFAVSIYVAGTIIGSTLSRFYPAWAAGQMGWELAFICAGGLMALAGGTVFIVKRKTQIHSWQPSARCETPTRELQLALCDKTLRIIYLAGFGLLFTQSSIFTALGIRLAEAPYSWGTGKIGLIYLACLPSLLFVLASKSIKRLVGSRVLAIGLFCLMWGSVLLVEVWANLIVFGVIVFAISTYMMQTITTEKLSGSKNVTASVAAGLYLAFYYLGGAIGATLSAYAYDAWAWTGVIACVAIIQAVIICLILCVRHCSFERYHHARSKA